MPALAHWSWSWCSSRRACPPCRQVYPRSSVHTSFPGLHDAPHGTRAAADPPALPRAARDERAPEPRFADLVRPREAVVRDVPGRPPRRRTAGHLGRGAARDAGDAGRRGARGLLRPAVRRPQRLGGRPPEPRPGLGGDRRRGGGRVADACAEAPCRFDPVRVGHASRSVLRGGVPPDREPMPRLPLAPVAPPAVTATPL